jgi:hypothetical protein
MDSPVYDETLAAWGWEECVVCLMPERPGGHHSHRAQGGWPNAHRDLLRSRMMIETLCHFAMLIPKPDRLFIV